MKSRWLPSKTSWAVAKSDGGEVVFICDSEKEAWELAAENPELDVVKVRST